VLRLAGGAVWRRLLPGESMIMSWAQVSGLHVDGMAETFLRDISVEMAVCRRGGRGEELLGDVVPPSVPGVGWREGGIYGGERFDGGGAC
jgi:hypothetical protein